MNTLTRNKLALFGGDPLISPQFPAWPVFDQNEVQAVRAIAESGQWGADHPILSQLESNFAKFQGTRYALAVTNGSQTMEMILRALGIGPGDEVIVPAYTFVATATAVLMVGATPIVVDVQADTMTLDPEAFRTAITSRTRAVMTVHLAGVTGAIDEICQIAQSHNIEVIEDCAHAHGAEFKGRRTGGFGIAGSFSFQGGKVITSGEGGMITTNDEQLYQRCWSLREGGRQQQFFAQPDFSRLGSNYRMTAFQAAVTQIQLDRFADEVPRRLHNIQLLDQGLSQIEGITSQYRHPESASPGYLYLFYYNPEAFNGLSRYLFVSALQAEGIPGGLSGYPPLYRTALFQDRAFSPAGLPVTDDFNGHPLPDYASMFLPNVERISRDVVCLPHSVMLGEPEQMERIVDAICRIQNQSYKMIRPANKLVFGLATVKTKVRSKLRLDRRSAS